MQHELEDLRKHEDDLIFTEGNFFLIALTLLATAVNIGALSVKILIVITAIVLSIFWILIGIRHRALMNWYIKEIINHRNSINSSDQTNLSQIHIKLRDWKKQNCSYRCTGLKFCTVSNPTVV